MRPGGPPYTVKVCYDDGRFAVYCSDRWGYVAYDREGGLHLWGGRCYWSLLIYIWAESNAWRVYT